MFCLFKNFIKTNIFYVHELLNEKSRNGINYFTQVFKLYLYYFYKVIVKPINFETIFDIYFWIIDTNSIKKIPYLTCKWLES